MLTLNQLARFKFLSAAPEAADSAATARHLLRWAQEMPRALAEWDTRKASDAAGQARQTMLETGRAFAGDLEAANGNGAARRLAPEMLQELERLAGRTAKVLREIEKT